MCTRFSFFHVVSEDRNVFGADLSSHGRTYQQFPELKNIDPVDLIEIDWQEGTDASGLRTTRGGNNVTRSVAQRQILARFPHSNDITKFLATQAEYVSGFTPEWQDVALASWPKLNGSVRRSYDSLSGQALFDAIGDNAQTLSYDELNNVLNRLDGANLADALNDWEVPLSLVEAHAYRLKGEQALDMGAGMLGTAYRNYAMNVMTEGQVYSAMTGAWPRVSGHDRAVALGRLTGDFLAQACINFVDVARDVRAAAAARLTNPTQRAQVINSIT